MLTVLEIYSGVVLLVLLGLITVAIAEFLDRCASFESTPVNLVIISILWMLGYFPSSTAALALATTAAVLQALQIQGGVSLLMLALLELFPTGAHWTLVSHYAHAQSAWTAHLYGFQNDAPGLPRAAPHDVVALLAGTIWGLPLYHLVCITTEQIVLPTRVIH